MIDVLFVSVCDQGQRIQWRDKLLSYCKNLGYKV